MAPHIPDTIDEKLLGLYLSDHLTGATAGLGRIERMAKDFTDTPVPRRTGPGRRRKSAGNARLLRPDPRARRPAAPAPPGRRLAGRARRPAQAQRPRAEPFADDPGPGIRTDARRDPGQDRRLADPGGAGPGPRARPGQVRRPRRRRAGPRSRRSAASTSTPAATPSARTGTSAADPGTPTRHISTGFPAAASAALKWCRLHAPPRKALPCARHSAPVPSGNRRSATPGRSRWTTRSTSPPPPPAARTASWARTSTPRPVHPGQARHRPGRRRLRLRRRRAVQAVPDGHQPVGGSRTRPRRSLRRDPPHPGPGPRAAVPRPQDAGRDRTRRPEERQPQRGHLRPILGPDGRK